MRVQLSDKPNPFINKAARESFLGNCKWLGQVWEGGQHGALMQGPDGDYFLCKSSKQYYKIDPDEVALAMADYLTRTAPKIKRGRGRPPLSEADRQRPVSVAMPLGFTEHAKRLGDGSVSEGMRRCIRFALMNEPQFKDWLTNGFY